MSPEIGSLLINEGHLHLSPDFFPFLSISLQPPLNSPYLLVPLNYILIFLLFVDCFLFCSYPTIFNKCPVKFCFYLALEAEVINECSRLFICCQYSQLYAFYIQTFKRHKSEIVEPAATLGPPLCIIGSHFCLSDCSACLSYQRVECQMQATENTCAICVETNILKRKKCEGISKMLMHF